METHDFSSPPPPASPPGPQPLYNRFLQAGREGKNQWWRYIVGIVLTFIAGYSLIGAVPVLLLVLRGVLKGYFTLGQLQGNSQAVENPAFLHVSSNTLLASLLFIFVAAMFFLWIAVRFVHKKRFLSIINYEGNRFDYRRFFVAAGIWTVISIVAFAISYISDPGNFQLVFRPGPFTGTLLICLVMLPVQTGWEELFLRGYIMQGLGLWMKKPVWPLLITAVIFGLLHMQNEEVKANGALAMFPSYFLPGLVFGMIALLDERLELAMGLHFANNLFGILTVTSPDMSIQANAIWKVSTIGNPSDIIGGALSLFLVLGILWRMYKWNAQKLLRAY
ncbi:MAG TPA: CPBP family glutamic-type intramembrane protease [Bacteroidia bacterium]|nr:CPBP family glutamic-type intramembrane protease [Bacteroidia bacterium]